MHLKIVLAKAGKIINRVLRDEFLKYNVCIFMSLEKNVGHDPLLFVCASVHMGTYCMEVDPHSTLLNSPSPFTRHMEIVMYWQLSHLPNLCCHTG